MKRTRVAKRAKANVLRFKDKRKSNVYIEPSEIFTDSLWIACIGGHANDTSMYLTKPMARRLAKALMRFCEGGK